MSDLTWDDLLDDYEDSIDASNDALDRGLWPPAETAVPPSAPRDSPELHHRERFNELQAEATGVAARLRSAMGSNESLRAQDRARVHAHREYKGSSARRS